MPALERIKNLAVENLTVGGVPVAGAAGPRVVGGRATVTGSGKVPTGLASIAAASVCLGQDPSLAAMGVSVTWSGGTLAVKVARPASAADATPVPAAAPAVVHWIAIGS